MKILAITTGDPAGIGPEITVKALQFHALLEDTAYVVYGRYPYLKQGHTIQLVNSLDDISEPGLYHINIDDETIQPGFPSRLSGSIAVQILEQAASDLKSGKANALLTAPVAKSWIRHTHPDFIGHTEFLAEKAGTETVIMSFWGQYWNLALLTTHVAVQDVHLQLQPDMIKSKLRLIWNETRKINPDARFAILGINPHAGEEGAFGNQDSILSEILKELAAHENIHIEGPFPADTFFPVKSDNYDMVISAYHDQGLIPFKMMSAGRGVNVTLGLPYYRASVDHGTAFDIAQAQIADHGSMSSAMQWLESRLGSEAPEIQSYSAFAEFYDNYMKHVHYDEWVEFILSHYLKKHKQNPRQVLEIACGTANVATRLRKKGLTVSACDLSEAMLTQASYKPFKPYLFQSDMLTPLKPDYYDLILCLFDSINYLVTADDVITMLKHVEAGLTTGGMFIFDISTHLNSLDNFEDYLNVDEDHKNVLVHHAYFDNSSWFQYNDLSLFVNRGPLYFRHREKHEQHVYKVKEILSFLAATNLNVLGIFGGLEPRNLKNHNPSRLDHQYTRVFFVVEKPAS